MTYDNKNDSHLQSDASSSTSLVSEANADALIDALVQKGSAEEFDSILLKLITERQRLGLPISNTTRSREFAEAGEEVSREIKDFITSENERRNKLHDPMKRDR